MHTLVKELLIKVLEQDNLLRDPAHAWNRPAIRRTRQEYIGAARLVVRAQLCLKGWELKLLKDIAFLTTLEGEEPFRLDTAETLAINRSQRVLEDGDPDADDRDRMAAAQLPLPGLSSPGAKDEAVPIRPEDIDRAAAELKAELNTIPTAENEGRPSDSGAADPRGVLEEAADGGADTETNSAGASANGSADAAGDCNPGHSGDLQQRAASSSAASKTPRPKPAKPKAAKSKSNGDIWKEQGIHPGDRAPGGTTLAQDIDDGWLPKESA